MKVNSRYSNHAKNVQPAKALGSRDNGRVENHSGDSSHRVKDKVRSPYLHKIEKVERREVEHQANSSMYDFKVLSTKEVTSVEVMPLGQEGVVTSWNPDGLNAKKLLRERYDEGAENPRSKVFGYFRTRYAPLSPEGKRLHRQIFIVKRGFDIAVAPTKRNEDGTISASRFSPYKNLAVKLDEIVDRMVENPEIDDTHCSRAARHRINGDIIRVGSGVKILGHYEEEEWRTLADFAMVVRADKARAPESTRYYIDDNIRDSTTSFKKRFGNGVDSIYEGAAKGGAKKLKEKQELYADLPDAELTDTRSETLPRKYLQRH